MKRRDLWEQQDGRCFYCSCRMVLPKHGNHSKTPFSDTTATLDHVIPASRGGGGGENLVYACYKCNRAKGNKLPSHVLESKGGILAAQGDWELTHSGWKWTGARTSLASIPSA